jgi:peptidoglycan/LPS O-acetylase OafA/YrhL
MAARRVDFLDGIRGLAAIYVVFGHILGTVWNPFQGEVIAGPFSFVRLLPSAHWSVTVFILLSGFCLALPLVQGKPLVMKEYFIRRFIRIVPPYWITLAISVALILTLLHDETGTIWDLSRSVDAKGLISHAFLLHNAVDQSITINYPLWTVAVEWQIYFFLP